VGYHVTTEKQVLRCGETPASNSGPVSPIIPGFNIYHVAAGIALASTVALVASLRR
jgi:hypothetical protein